MENLPEVELIPAGALIEWNNRLWTVMEECVVRLAPADPEDENRFAYG